MEKVKKSWDNVENFFKTGKDKFDGFIASTAQRRVERWVSIGVIALLLLVRVIITKKHIFWYYCMCTFILSRFILFVSPSGLEKGVFELPTTDAPDYKPIERQLPEFGFWKSCSVAVLVFFLISIFPFMNIPVLWEFVVIYLVILIVYVVVVELSVWKRLNVPPKEAMKQWFGLIKKKKFVSH